MIDILYIHTPPAVDRASVGPPGFFADVNLDQIIDAVTQGRETYDLKPDFRTPLRSLEEIRYRHETMRDLEDPGLFQGIKAFSGQLGRVRGHLRQLDQFHESLQKDRWFLEAVKLYADAAAELRVVLADARLGSMALTRFRTYLDGYLDSGAFQAMRSEVEAISDQLGQVRYTLLIDAACVTVQRSDQEQDFGQRVLDIFAKFKQGEVKTYLVDFHKQVQLNGVESRILDRVALLYPETFTALADFRAQHADFIDPSIHKFERDIQFFLAYLEFLAPMKQAGLPFCLPTLSNRDRSVHCLDGFDLALARKLVAQGSPIVCNDFHLDPEERVLVVTGPNQGGKTTFARSVAQWHYLASLGCPVPGREARLFLVDRIFTHFEKEEVTTNLRGKLQDELIRIQEILHQATGDSLIVINEMFASTVWQDATMMALTVLDRILDLGAICVWVTFLEELAGQGGRTVSLVSVIEPGDQVARTFKIRRQPADGFAYAQAIAEKHGLTYGQLKERI